MALVVRSNANNHGRVVTCLEYVGTGHIVVQNDDGKPVRLVDHLHWWRVDRKMNVLQGGVTYLENFSPFMADEFMLPINGLGDTIKSRETEEEPA